MGRQLNVGGIVFFFSGWRLTLHRVIAQIIGASSQTDGAAPVRQQYASFSWCDLWAIAPWLEERITKRIDGAGLGH